MNALDLLGLVATCFTTSSFVPQVWRTWKTRDVSGISLPTYVIITIGLALWLVYGWLRGDLPLIVANAVMVLLTCAITVMKLRYGRSQPPAASALSALPAACENYKNNSYVRFAGKRQRSKKLKNPAVQPAAESAPRACSSWP